MEMKNLILDLLENKDINALKKILLDANNNDILDVIQTLDEHEKAIVFRLLPKDSSLHVFEHLETSDQEKLIGSLTDERAIEIIGGLDPDDRVRLLDELPTEVTKKMLAALSSEERAKTNLLMGYEAETAGRLMNPNFVRLKASLTVTEALGKVKRKAFETIYILYVTDDRGKLEGVLSLRTLLLADPEAIIGNLMVKEIIKVSTSTDQEEVARLLQKRDLLAVPVVDKNECIVGIITVDDAMDILEQEATEDILNKAGLAKGRGEIHRSENMIKGSIWSVWRIRLPFLVITLVGGLLAGSVLGFFEETLEAIIIAAMFIPVVMDMGGNVGVQSSTIFQRGALLGHITDKKMKKHITRETTIGLSMGIVVGIVCGLVAFGFASIGFMGDGMSTADSALLGLAVGLSLVIVMTLAATIGFVIPYVLMKNNIDQAAATDPIITSIKDIIGLFAYFGLVTILLSHLL